MRFHREFAALGAVVFSAGLIAPVEAQYAYHPLPDWAVKLQEEQRAQDEQIRLEAAQRVREVSAQAAIEAAARAKQNAADSRAGFRRTTVRELEIDKRSVASGQKLIVGGLYYTEGQQEWLGIVPDNDRAPRIGLITSGAPRDTQYALQRCRISTMCSITFIGHMVACQQTLFGRSYADDRCLYVTGRR